MEPEQTSVEQDLNTESKKSVWNTVTPLSKYLAMALFVILPFVGGYIGYTYVPEKVVEVERVVIVEKNSTNQLDTTIDTEVKPNDTVAIDQREICIEEEKTLTDGLIEWRKCPKNSNLGEFTIRYPAEWSHSSSVFKDENGEKIAEFSPGVTVGTNCTVWADSFETTDGYQKDLYTREAIMIGELSGELWISGNVTGPSGLYWYPFSYCIEKDDKIFRMNFYERVEIEDANRELFESILGTVDF